MLYLWVAIVIILALIELITVNLTNIWFVISGLIAILVSIYTKNFFIQFAVFILVGIILLIITRPLVRKVMIKRYSKISDELLGSIGVVIKEIKKNNYGEILVNGINLIAYSDEKIRLDATVKIVQIDSNKVKVEEV